MSIILGNGDVLKDLQICNKVINKAVVGNKVVWQKNTYPKWLTFTSNQDNSTVGYTVYGTIDKDIYTSSDGKTWTSWDGSNITLNNGESRYIWNKTNTLSTSTLNYLKFTMSGLISASGNVNSMINFSDLTPRCYNYMFSRSNLTTPPELPATTLADNCYSSMFAYCSNLTTAPELPATTLANNCYGYMFNTCLNLTTPPDLPATTLADNCYSSMFAYCSNITTAPDLPATTLNDNCYNNMFMGCTSLNSIKLSYEGNFDSNYFKNWVKNVSSTGTLYYNGSDTTRGNGAIPQNWAVQQF